MPTRKSLKAEKIQKNKIIFYFKQETKTRVRNCEFGLLTVLEHA